MDRTKPSPMFRAIVLAGVALTACGSSTEVTGDDAGASPDGTSSDATSANDAGVDGNSGDAIAPPGDAGVDADLDADVDSGAPSDARDDFPLIK